MKLQIVINRLSANFIIDNNIVAVIELKDLGNVEYNDEIHEIRDFYITMMNWENSNPESYIRIIGELTTRDHRGRTRIKKFLNMGDVDKLFISKKLKLTKYHEEMKGVYKAIYEL